MTAKELRQQLRRGSFVYPFLAIQLLAVLATTAEFYGVGVQRFDHGVGLLNPVLLISSGPFWAVVSVICVLVIPLGGLLLMGQELDEGNHELLMLTKLNRWKIVLGKFWTLWGLSALTFVSLMPFVVVRYLIGGVEWWYELACAGTVLGISAMFCAATIAASGYRGLAHRILVLAAFLFSMLISGAIVLLSSGMATGSCGWIYHLNAIAMVVSYPVCALALARARLRLVVLAYEGNPSAAILAQTICLPAIAGFLCAISVGYAGGLGVLIMAWVATRLDLTPSIPKWMVKRPPDLPSPKANA